MPYKKVPRKTQPLWKDWDYKAQKKGVRSTVYSVNGDEYTGEWLDNKKHGKGTQRWKKNSALYDGDWKCGKRSGFGTLSSPAAGGGFKRVYSGGWKNDKRHGYGTNFYSAEMYYEGEWYADKRSGWGRMYYDDDSIFEGEWYNDQRSGQGMQRLDNENRYEGSWKKDQKNGPGKFFYLDKGQVYEGVWLDNIPKCGTVVDFGREGIPAPTQYPIPELTLYDPDGVLQDAENMFLRDQE